MIVCDISDVVKLCTILAPRRVRMVLAAWAERRPTSPRRWPDGRQADASPHGARGRRAGQGHAGTRGGAHRARGEDPPSQRAAEGHHRAQGGQPTRGHAGHWTNRGRGSGRARHGGTHPQMEQITPPKAPVFRFVNGRKWQFHSRTTLREVNYTDGNIRFTSVKAECMATLQTARPATFTNVKASAQQPARGTPPQNGPHWPPLPPRGTREPNGQKGQRADWAGRSGVGGALAAGRLPLHFNS